MLDPLTTRIGTIANRRLTVAEIHAMCGGTILGVEAFEYVDGVTTPDRLLPHRLVFVQHEGLTATLNSSDCRDVLVIATEPYRNVLKHPRLITDLPRVCFARAVKTLFDLPGKAQTQPIDTTARIHPSAQISIGVTIGASSVVGEGTYIHPNVTIGPRVRIGRNCVIKSGTVIGQSGFGVYRDAESNPHVLPHVAGVVVGDHVEIGALNSVASGTIHPTVIEDWVKTDDQVHVAHNCRVGARTLLTACAELSGSVVLGPDCWVGPNASIRDGVEIGAKAFIGIAANVVGPVAAGQTVLGNPARPRPEKQ